ncbi:hypothetical protein [Streptomyces pseudogriseolus]|nr:hypothetical protein [Streptomyces pseudogriseolus]
MSVEIELVGGPTDGRRLAVLGDPFGPPPAVKAAELLPDETEVAALSRRT